jgi:hypothetical protein
MGKSSRIKYSLGIIMKSKKIQKSKDAQNRVNDEFINAITKDVIKGKMNR